MFEIIVIDVLTMQNTNSAARRYSCLDDGWKKKKRRHDRETVVGKLQPIIACPAADVVNLWLVYLHFWVVAFSLFATNPAVRLVSASRLK